MANQLKYSNDGTGALSMALVRAPEDAESLKRDELHLVSSFHPKFVYPIFGEEEQIYGYEDLEIELQFASGSLAMYLDISFKSTIPASTGITPDPIEEKLYQFIPPDYTKDAEKFAATIAKDAVEFKPLGEKIASYSRKPKSGGATNGKGKGRASAAEASQKPWVDCEEGDEGAVTYELWRADWKTPGFREYHRRMQVFILLYIEGGSYIEEDEDRWEFTVLFEKRSKGAGVFTYHFVGYVTFYPFYHYPSRIRLRLSQFVILPPYQNAGHGSMLYSKMYEYLLTREDVAELTVEDPSEAFEDLRDRCDLKTVISKGLFAGLEAPVERAKYEEIRNSTKIADRQFSRLLEMVLKAQLASSKRDAKKERAYRLWVKERLYRFNYEMLKQMEKEERRDRLQDTFEGVMEDYERIMRGERRESG